MPCLAGAAWTSWLSKIFDGGMAQLLSQIAIAHTGSVTGSGPSSGLDRTKRLRIIVRFFTTDS